MTSAERTSPAIPDHWDSLESSREWLQTQHGDWILPSINARHFGSPRNAAEDPSKSHAQKVLAEHFGGRLHQEDRLYIIIGSDSGQLLRFIREHAPTPRGSRWLVIEPEGVLQTLQQNPALGTYCDDYVQLVAFDEWRERANLLQLSAYFRIDGVRLERSLGALDNTDPDYVEHTARLDAHLTAERFRTIAQINAAPFIEPNILSAPNFHGGVDSFEKIFAGKTAVIVAGGPSLDDQINWLIEHRNALFVIAVSRVSGRLQAVGLKPDIVVTVDPFPISLIVSRQIFDFSDETILFTGSHPYPELTNRWPHTIFCVGQLVPWADQTVNDHRSIPSLGPTVTHTAAQLAVFMGFREIVFFGLDLCHAPDGRTHAAGSSEAEAGPIMDFSAIPVTTNKGESTWTTPDYFAGIQAMAEIAGLYKSVRFVNPGPNAATINHVEFEPLRNITVPPGNFDRFPLDRIRLNTNREVRATHLKALAESMEAITEDMRKVTNLAQLGLESNQAYFNLTHPARQKRHKRRMQAIDRLFEGRYRQAARLAQRAAKRAILQTALPHDFFELDRQQAENLASRYYDAIREEARRLVGPLELARNRIDTRLMELRDDVDSEEIASRYLEFEEPERIGWLEANRETTSGPQAKRARLAYASSIENLLEKDRERHRRKRSPRASLRQIERHFTSQKPKALASLASSLEYHKEADVARPYARYADGLLNELSDDLLVAAENHAKVVEHADPQQDAVLLEHALLRMSHINLEAGQSENALAILQTAATLNPTHWRLVARLALLENEAETGITALTRHLEHFPSDVGRIKQMIRLFVALQIPDGIDFCEQYLPYCSPTGRSELREFLDQARATLDMPSK